MILCEKYYYICRKIKGSAFSVLKSKWEFKKLFSRQISHISTKEKQTEQFQKWYFSNVSKVDKDI